MQGPDNKYSHEVFHLSPQLEPLWIQVNDQRYCGCMFTLAKSAVSEVLGKITMQPAHNFNDNVAINNTNYRIHRVDRMQWLMLTVRHIIIVIKFSFASY